MAVPAEVPPMQDAAVGIEGGEAKPEPAKASLLENPLGIAAEPPLRVIPDAELLQQKRTELRGIYKTEYASTKPTVRQELAATLFSRFVATRAR